MVKAADMDLMTALRSIGAEMEASQSFLQFKRFEDKGVAVTFKSDKFEVTWTMGGADRERSSEPMRQFHAEMVSCARDFQRFKESQRTCRDDSAWFRKNDGK